jgi:glyceraldehyde 3-phosphate dehydrogenase
MKVGINGMGRIGRLALRAAMGAAQRPGNDPGKNNRLDVVHVNEIKGSAATLAHLLEFDSVQGRWRENIGATDNTIHIGEHDISVSNQSQSQDIAWDEYGVDLVLECTGKLLAPETIEGHLQRGAKRVIVAAPVKVGGVLNIVYGINHTEYQPQRDRIVTAASCTTNCLAPVVKVVHEHLGIRHGQITTIHDPTNTNLMVDGVHKDLRRARSAMLSLSPTTTGSATAISLIYPELAGKLNGHAVRAPVLNASLTDAVFELQKPTTADAVNALFREAANGTLAGILGYEDRPLVSADYAQDTRSSIIDALSTMVTDSTMLKVYAWYDNELGYACRMVDLACYMDTVGL